MRASNLQNGDMFVFAVKFYGTGLYQAVAHQDAPLEWQRYPGQLYRNLSNGMYGGLGPAVQVIVVSADTIEIDDSPVLPQYGDIELG
jgi:hypothetical protein